MSGFIKINGIEVAVPVSGPNKLLGRTTTGAGGHEEITISALTAETAPAAGDYLLLELAEGDLRKLDIGDLPGGGGGGDSLGAGFTSGGGTGSIPDGTVINAIDVLFTTTDIGFDSALVFGKDIDQSTGDLFAADGGVVLYTGADDGKRAYFRFNSEEKYAVIGGVLPDYGYATTRIENDSITFRGQNLEGPGTENMAFSISGHSGITITDSTAAQIGITYGDDYSATIAANDRSVPDVFTVNLLKQTPVSYANGDAPNNCIFYSTTNSKLAYKDPGGTVNNLY